MAVTRPTARRVLRGGSLALALASGVAGEASRRLTGWSGGNQSIPIFQDYAHAAAAADSYEAADVVELVARKTEAEHDALQTTRPAIAHRQTQQDLFVLDHVSRASPNRRPRLRRRLRGSTFFRLDRLLPDAIRRWFVVETPAMAAAGARRLADGRLRFFDDLDEAVTAMGRPDLLVAAGVIQCTPDPSGAITLLFEVAPSYLYLSRTSSPRRSAGLPSSPSTSPASPITDQVRRRRKPRTES